ncbi:MAG: RNA-binding cell elongation regulator Jag/EloR [Candidatus Onthovivens sp.]|nr:RNA-binding cell elongation regulator Jag/EloR [Candidatus Onthovivens sp.]
MKKYTAKTVEEAVKLASEDLKIEESELVYEIEEEKKTLFTKKATIAVYEVADIIEYAEEYIKTVINGLGLEVSLQTFYRDGVAKILIETNKNSLIIGKNGSTLQSLNELVKLACNTKFKRKVRILLDIGDYKDKKYSKVISLAKRSAKEVLKTHVDIKLDPMTPDERKKVHNALSTFKNIKTESVGDGKERSIVIKYVGTIKNNESNKANENNALE